MLEKIILHIDFDSFFASCEQQFEPKFRGKPLGVTAHNGRTAIIAASREAKAKGVKAPSRTFDAFQVCPELLLTTSHFDKYWEISKKFLNICKDYTPYIELFSLDEVFMDVTQTAHLFGGVDNLITRIKDRIAKEIGEYITVSVGISHNKLLAKLASGLAKPARHASKELRAGPNGVFEIRKDDVENVYSFAKLTDICGIGERIALRLNKIGVYSLLQLRDITLHLLIGEFGEIEGNFLKNVGFGIDTSSLILYTEAPEVKSVGRNYCLARNEYNKRIVLQNVYELCEEVCIKLRRLGKKARTVGLSLRGNIDIHGQKTDTYYFDSGKEMFEMCLLFVNKETPCTRSLLVNATYFRQISVWASNLEDATRVPFRMFENEQKKEKVQKAIDAINERFGDHTIRNGFLLYADKLTTMPNGFMADRFERSKLALETITESKL